MKIKIKCTKCGNTIKPNGAECLELIFGKYKSCEFECQKCGEILRFTKEEIEEKVRI